MASYISRYGKGTDPEPLRFGEGGERIYEADLMALRRKIKIVTDMAKKRGSPSRRFIPRLIWVTDSGRPVRRAA